MYWGFLTVVAVFVNVASSQNIRYPCAVPATSPACAPTSVNGNVIQSLIDTIQRLLYTVSGLVEETLQEKKDIVPSAPMYVGCDEDCCNRPYEYVINKDCPDFVTALMPRPAPKVCVNVPSGLHGFEKLRFVDPTSTPNFIPLRDDFRDNTYHVC